MAFENLPPNFPRGVADDINHLVGIEIAFEQRRIADLEAAQAAARQAYQEQSVTYTQPDSEVQISPFRTSEFERGRPGERPPVYEPYRYDSHAPQPLDAPEDDGPIVGSNQGSYGKAIATVVAAGGLVLGGIFMANQEDAPKADAPAPEISHELAYDCQVTDAKEINQDTAVVTFAKPVNTDHYNIEIGSINDQKELVSRTVPGPVSGNPPSFAFTVDGFEDQRLVVKVTDNHGDSTFCDGAFGVSQNPGDTWVDQKQSNK